MANPPVLMKRSNVPGKVPATAQVPAGGLAVNTADRRMFFSAGDIIKALANVDDLSSKQNSNSYLTSLSALSTSAKGLVVDTDGVASVVALLGTDAQVVVTNGNGSAGNPTISLADDVVLPGSGAVHVPSGLTEQRKQAAIDGDFRYNESMQAFEGRINGNWSSFIAGSTDLAAFQMRRTTTQSLNTTQTEITFNTVEYANQPAVLSQGSPTSRMVVGEDGLYAITFDCEQFNTTNGSVDYFQMRLNGVAIPRGLIAISCRSTRQHATKTIYMPLVAGDYITVAAYSNTGTSGTLQIGAMLSGLRLNGAQGPAGPAGGQSSLYYPAATLDNPNNSNWAVNALAPVTPDTANAALNVRSFDDTAEEGVGCTIYIPPYASNITITLMAKAATAPATAKSAMLNLYNRLVPVGAALPGWSSAFALNALAIGTNVFYQTYTQTVSLAALGMVAGQTYQLELTRNGVSASDTLAGDLQLLQLTLTFA